MERAAMGAREPEAADGPDAGTPRGRVVARFLPAAERTRLDAASHAGTLRRVGAVDLLEQARLPDLARASLWLFLMSGAGFIALDLAARQARNAGPLLGTSPLPLRLLVLVITNLAAYAAMIVVHELLHAAAIFALGGSPRFGLKWPLTAYCTAPGQLFTPAGYIFVALTPLVALTIAGVLITWYFPDVGALLWLALVGNVSGAAGDLETVGQLRQMPGAALVADTATGFIAYALGERP
jgi:hypothetical protein